MAHACSSSTIPPGCSLFTVPQSIPILAPVVPLARPQCGAPQEHGAHSCSRSNHSTAATLTWSAMGIPGLHHSSSNLSARVALVRGAQGPAGTNQLQLQPASKVDRHMQSTQGNPYTSLLLQDWERKMFYLIHRKNTESQTKWEDGEYISNKRTIWNPRKNLMEQR